MREPCSPPPPPPQRLPPLILDLEAEHDTDHVIAVYQVDGCWGAVASRITRMPLSRTGLPHPPRAGPQLLRYLLQPARRAHFTHLFKARAHAALRPSPLMTSEEPVWLWRNTCLPSRTLRWSHANRRSGCIALMGRSFRAGCLERAEKSLSLSSRAVEELCIRAGLRNASVPPQSVVENAHTVSVAKHVVTSAPRRNWWRNRRRSCRPRPPDRQPLRNGGCAEPLAIPNRNGSAGTHLTTTVGTFCASCESAVPIVSPGDLLRFTLVRSRMST